MTWRAGFLALVVLAACDTPVPSLRLRLADGPAQACASTNCADVPMACATSISIRIIDPKDPTAPYLSQCVPVPQNRYDNLCSVANVDLAPTPLPVRDLEVQVAIYPESMVVIDPISGEGTCPTDITYDAVDGFPVDGEFTPALGGRTYYRPGDEEVLVTLGCTDLEAINDVTCVGVATVAIGATVEDFDLRISVDPSEAARLSVGVGEPTPSNNRYVLNPGAVTTLEQTTTAPPAWGGDVEQLFTFAACLTVLDDTPQSTTTIRCQRAVVVDDILRFTSDRTGVRMHASTLDQILTALGMAQFPFQGITIGVVLDVNGNPLANQVVSAAGSTINYLSTDRTSVVGTTTSPNGIFVSTDAPFGTTFFTSSGPMATAEALGGLVEGKVTIVMLKYKGTIVDPT